VGGLQCLGQFGVGQALDRDLVAFHFRCQFGSLGVEFLGAGPCEQAHGLLVFDGRPVRLVLAAGQLILPGLFRGDGMDPRFQVGAVRAGVGLVGTADPGRMGTMPRRAILIARGARAASGAGCCSAPTRTGLGMVAVNGANCSSTTDRTR
jgi:hypothetical protein